jgi:DNA sulfur modification protein DndE
MRLNKIILSKDASEQLKQLKARTGLTPNILSRIGLCLSLTEPAIPDASLYPEHDREFNRYTLLGEWDGMYVALLRQRLLQDELPADEMECQFRAHLHRGIASLSKLAKSVNDIIRLCARGTVAPRDER